MTPSFLFPLGSALQYLGLALIIGGMLALGAFTAPVVFKQFARPDAGAAMTVIFRRYDTILTGALVLVLLGEIIRAFSAGAGLALFSGMGWVTGFRYGLILILAALFVYSLTQINPAMAQMQAAREATGEVTLSQEFQKTHVLSEKLYKLELFVALGILLLTPFVASPPLES